MYVGKSEGEYKSSMVQKKKLNIGDAMSRVLQDDESRKYIASMVKGVFDGTPMNKNPLNEIPTPQMRLYGIFGAFHSVFFDTEEELAEYIQNNDTSLGCVCVIEFLGNVAGCNDVVRKTSKDGLSILYTVVDEDGYGIYNSERSTYRGEFTWEYHHGSLKEIYSAFRDRGIVFTDDIYAKSAERNQHMLRYCRKDD